MSRQPWQNWTKTHSSLCKLRRFRFDSRNRSRCISISESMDHCRFGGLASASSRSCSIRSQYSSSSGSSNTTAASAAIHKQRI
ncbi:hypothetical protein U1Q18_032378 [Sarracenia purpurea var. burkii]